MEEEGSELITRKMAKKILNIINIYNVEVYLKEDYYSFDHILSIIG